MNTLDTIFILGLSIIPALMILGLILYSDRESKEPILLILFCFFSGFITTFLALNIQKVLMNSIELLSKYKDFSTNTCLILFFLSSIEEYCKLFILYISILWLLLYSGFQILWWYCFSRSIKICWSI